MASAPDATAGAPDATADAFAAAADGTVVLPLSEYRRLMELDRKDRARKRARERRAAHPPQDGVAAVGRMIRSLGKQTVPFPSDLEVLTEQVREAQADIVDRLMRDEGWSWVMVARNLGITHQGARKRFRQRGVKTLRQRGAQPAAFR